MEIFSNVALQFHKAENEYDVNTHDDADDEESDCDGNDLESLNDDSSNCEKDEADNSVPDEGGHPVGNWAD